MKTISISEVKFYEDRIPIAVLVDEEQKPVGYLSPFRAYSFQVSSTFEGVGDEGSTEVFGIKNVIYSVGGQSVKDPDNWYGWNSNVTWLSTIPMILKGMALTAMQKFAERNDAAITLEARGSEWDENRKLSNGRVLGNLIADKLDKFIMETIIWLAPDVAALATYEDK